MYSISKPVEWTYNFYRASLYRGGRIFAIVSPDGQLALAPDDAATLCDELNDMPSNPQDLLKRINGLINVECFEDTLEKEGSDILDFQTTWASYGSFQAFPPKFKKAVLVAEHALSQTTALAL